MKYMTSLITLLFATGAYYMFKRIFTGAFTFESWEYICFTIIWQMTWLRIAIQSIQENLLVVFSYAKVLSNKHLGKLNAQDFEFASENNGKEI